MNYLIIGSGVAAIAAIEAVRSIDKLGGVTLIGEDPHGFYSRPGLAYYLTGELHDKALYPRTAEDYRRMNFRFVKGRVKSILRGQAQVEMEDGRFIPYDKLMIAVGAQAMPLQVPGADLEGVLKLDHMEDARRILKSVRRGRTAVVLGGGITALETHAVTDYADIFSAVVLVDITPKVENAGSRRIVSFMMANPDGFADLTEAAAAIAEYNPHRPPPSSTAGLAKVLRQGEDGRWRWHWDPQFIATRAALMLEDPAAWEAERAERADRLHLSAGALKAPLLLIRGLLSDLVSDEAVAALRAAAPQAEYVDVRGAGHMVAGDDNDAFTSAVLGFLDRHVRPTP